MMTTTKIYYELTKDDIKIAILNYIGEHSHIDDFNMTVNDYKNTTNIDMTKDERVCDIKCFITVCETK